MLQSAQSKSSNWKISDNNIKSIENLKKAKGSIACSEAKQRERHGFVGEIKSTRMVPRGISRWLEVVISDGTGKINGWFFGRNEIAGMQLGSLVYFEGLVQLDQGEMTIANPYYELL